MRFTSGMSEDELIREFDEFHKEVTGEWGYPDDADKWYKFRMRLILLSHRVLIDDDGWNEE